ncbi:quaternary ammonium compound efflux SMR transporter SugE [Congregibacter brevis]|uniref:Guanidinium exporter n=1 Tax=Congregibacter brevis TaxID=3081201 RepID=A0ABZ0IGB9_9GAMM|nr:quaternary ammonium compound efflux SMR transporter SugE [Congregibacter sp. IMCC45268]
MAWVLLVAAGFFEIVWAIALKYSDGFTRLWPSVIFGVAAWISFAFLAQAVRVLPMGTAYAVWTGIGAVGLAVAGIIWFEESASLLRVACITLIVVGIVGLKLSSADSSIV